MITRQDIKAHLDATARTGLVLGLKEYTPMRTAFVNEMPSTKAFEVITDIGSPPWPAANAGKLGSGGQDARSGAYISGKINAGQNVTVLGGEEKAVMVYPIDWETTVGITHNSIDDDQTSTLDSWARGAAVNFQRHMDYLSFQALDAGDASTYGVGYDGLTFFNDAHIDPGAQYQTAQDNLFALTLTLDNFRTTRVSASKFMEGRGIPLGLNHNLLIVPPDLEYEAFQIASNPEAYDTANRERNPYSGRVSVLVTPGGWFGTTSWVVVDPNQTVKPLRLVVRKQPQLTIWDDEAAGDGGMRYYKFHARYNLVYQDWRTAYLGAT